MITVGIDVGAKNVKVVILKDKEVVATGSAVMEMDREKSVRELFEATLTKAGLREREIDYIVAGGAGSRSVPFATNDSTQVTCIARGVHAANPAIRTVVDIGANDSIAVKIDEAGKVVDFAVNEKCAAGAGSFVEAMARAMEVSLKDFEKYSLMSTKSIPINAQCVIFAESEVVSLVHEDTDRNDICRAVHDAMAQRIASMARRIRIESPVAIVGGAAYNRGLLESLKNELGVDFVTIQNPEFVGAYGAAFLGAENLNQKNGNN